MYLLLPKNLSDTGWMHSSLEVFTLKTFRRLCRTVGHSCGGDQSYSFSGQLQVNVQEVEGLLLVVRKSRYVTGTSPGGQGSFGTTTGLSKTIRPLNLHRRLPVYQLP